MVSPSREVNFPNSRNIGLYILYGQTINPVIAFFNGVHISLAVLHASTVTSSCELLVECFSAACTAAMSTLVGVYGLQKDVIPQIFTIRFSVRSVEDSFVLKME
ncbi:hypothetical protein Tco_0800612 [Tanacetum coccineum]|uniref:Uncharacterized protein n=1 Tax=Tanacetum coccineum TaxID=301880 RepID=A0ABQ4ZTL7_9ASTR